MMLYSSEQLRSMSLDLHFHLMCTHLDCKMDTGPSCKELGLFNKYTCFSFDLHVYRLILESEGKKYEKTDLRPFLTPKQTPI